MNSTLPLWLVDFDKGYDRNELLANLGRESNRYMLLSNSKAARAALEYGLREALYGLLDGNAIPLDGMLRLLADGATTEASFLFAIFENDEFADLKQIALDKPLRLRYEFIRAGELLEGSQAVEFLCSFPSPQHVRSASPGKLFPVVRKLNNGAAKAIMQLHAQGNTLRENILKSGIMDGEVADFIEQNSPVNDAAPVNISTMVHKAQAAGVDSRAVCRYFQNLLAMRERKRVLSNGADQESSSDNTRPVRIAKLEALQEKLAEEEEIVKSPDKDAQDAALKRLQQLKKAIRPRGEWNQPIQETASRLLEELQASVAQSLTALREGDYDTITQMASLASSALLRKGMRLLPSRNESTDSHGDGGESEPNDGDGMLGEKVTVPGSALFLTAPLSAFDEPLFVKNFCFSPEMPMKGTEVHTTSLAAFSRFESSIQTHGMDFAVKAHLGGFFGETLASLGASYARQKQDKHGQLHHNHKELKTVCVAMCNEFPMCSFETAIAAITFTEDALRELAGIGRNHIRAMRFMERYGEVISVGTHTLGGARIFKMTLEKSSEEGLELSYDAVHKEWQVSLGLGGFFVAANAGVRASAGGRDRSVHSKGTGHGRHAYRRTLNTTFVGPQAINLGTFRDALKNSNKSWRVIGRDLSLNALVPIWEVVEHSSGATALKDPAQVAQVLRSAWCNRAIQVIDESHPLVLEEHRQVLMHLYNSETNSPLPMSISRQEGNKDDMEWIPSALKEVQEVTKKGLAATGDYAFSARRSALIEAFRIAHIRAPRSWQAAPQLRYIPFMALEFCTFVDALLEGQSGAVETVLRARLHSPVVLNDVMRVVRNHGDGTDSSAKARFPHLTSFLARIAHTEKEDTEEFTSVGVLGPDFPDAISLDEAFTWLTKLSDPTGKDSSSSYSSAAAQVLHAALVGIEGRRTDAHLDKHKKRKERMYAHLDRFNRLCRRYGFMRDHFLDGKDPSQEDLHCLANELRESILRKVEIGDVVKKELRVPLWQGSRDGDATMYGYVVDHDKAQTAHVRVHWVLLRGVKDVAICNTQAAQITGERWDDEEDESATLGQRDIFNRSKIFSSYVHVSDIELAPDLPSPSTDSLGGTGRSELGSGHLLQSEAFFGRIALCADRSSEPSPSTPLRYVDNLRWRLPDIDRNLAQNMRVSASRANRRRALRRAQQNQNVLGPQTSTSEGRNPDATTNTSGSRASGSSSSSLSPEMDVYTDLENAEGVDQVLICDALLDQRKAAPLFWRRGVEGHPDDLRGRDILPVLAFLRARLDIPKNMANLHTDKTLPRVVFYEPHPNSRPSAARMANDVLHTHFRRTAPSDLVVSLEMAVGFIDVQQAEEPSFVPCIVFLVRGDAHMLPEYLAHAFDAGVTVVSSCNAMQTVENLPQFLTRPDKAVCFSLVPSEDMPENWDGPVEDVSHEGLTDDVVEFVREVFQTWKELKLQWESMRSLFSTVLVSKRTQAASGTTGFSAERNSMTETLLFECATESLFDNLRFPDRDVRSSMKLQELFREEAWLKERQHGRERLKDIHVKIRREVAPRVLEDPIVKCFIEILQAPTRTQRLMRLQRFDEFLETASLQNGEVSQAQQRIYSIEREKSLFKTTEARINELENERRELVSVCYKNSIDLACLSRELGCLYSALFETNHREEVAYLPDLAAQLILDGGTVEFMDGDAAKVNRFWISSVLRALNRKLKDIHGGSEVRVSVRSVFGVQSCGKSTVLNCMFGCRLRTSVGACTRGINMFLVPCERPGSPFQAVLGLDTEGICSPEQERQNASETALINNRMALFCVLLADAGLCISTSEANDIFRETLSIVMAVYHGSDTAVRNRLRTRLFFLYNRSGSVDDVNGDQMKLKQDSMFLKVLRGAWKQASNQLGGAEEESQVIPPAFLALLDKDKDFERVQQLNQAPRAPNDVPDPDFGKKLAKFNDHIYNSLSQSSSHCPSAVVDENISACGTTLEEVIDRIRDVTEAVQWGKNYLLYPDILRYKQQILENEMFEANVHEASKLAYNEFVTLQVEMDKEHRTAKSEKGSAKPMETRSSAFSGNEWERSPWPARTRNMVYSAYDLKRNDMRQSLQRLMGASYDDKIAEYDRQWDEKARKDCDTKLRAMQEKWAVLNDIAPRLEKLKKSVYQMLFDEATTAREQSTSTDDFDNVVREKFEKAFEKARQKAEQEYPNTTNVKFLLLSIATEQLQPPLALPEKTLQYYMDEVIFAATPSTGGSNGLDGKNWFDRVKDRALRFAGYRDSPSEREEYITSMYDKVERKARSAPDEYSNHVAYEILSHMDRLIKSWNRRRPKQQFSDKKRTDLHMHIIAHIGDLLQKKHDCYHNKYGLAARIAEEKMSMFQYFNIMLRGKHGLDALGDMLRVELDRCLRDSRQMFAKHQMQLLLDSEPWIRSIEGSLALVDYEILQQYQKGNKVVALFLAADENSFRTTIAKYILLNLDARKVHKNMVRALTNALHLAKDACTMAAVNLSPWRASLEELSMRCAANRLTIDISASRDILDSSPPIKEDLDKTAEHFFTGLVDYVKDLPCDSSPFDGIELYVSMGRDLPAEGALQPRCGSGCPRCSMPCMKELGHDERYTGNAKLHSCTHQPSGLAGERWTFSNCLPWQSCVDSVKADHKMRRADGTVMPFKKFREWYPEWEQPPETQRSRPIREFLFYNCQDELVEKWTGAKKCDDLDESNFSRHILSDLLKSAEATAFRSGL